jgi:polar amino acid transport system substrate-binding protein
MSRAVHRFQRRRPAALVSRNWLPPFWAVWLVISGLCLLGVSACNDFQYPRDPNSTLDRVLAAKRMRVAAVDHPPWVIMDEGGVPRGAEVDLVEAFARELGVVVEWRRAPAFEAFEALKRGDADLAAGGLTKEAVTAHERAGQTYPFFTEALIVAAEPGAPVSQDLDGLRVYAAPGLMANGLIEKKGGIPVSEKTQDVRLVALLHWQLGGLVPTGIVLHRDEHVIAVPPGENAWVMRFERFLREHAGDFEARLREHAS